jgi:uncharacterized membrane protein
MEKQQCFLSKEEYNVNDLIKGYSLKPQLIKLIKTDYPDFSEEDYVSSDSINKYRKLYLESLIKKEYKKIGKIEQEVVKAIHNNELLSEDIEPEMESELTLGQHMADKIASFGGSWVFIIFFFSFLIVWMLINIFVLAQKPFDPYPFILLNLILSCLAAIQAPIIMMSQNRKEEKDRARSENDYKINLKAELEIRLLHEKLDHLMLHQNKRLLEIQELQLDYLEQIVNVKNK